MSDSASRDDKTSLRSTNQTEKMEEAAASATVAVAAAAAAATATATATAAAAPYPNNQKRILIMTAVYLAVFLVTLVRPAPFPGSNSSTLQIGLLT